VVTPVLHRNHQRQRQHQQQHAPQSGTHGSL
jgi:hypothetical protein